MRIVCISDTHTKRLPIPDGDLLIHAGDISMAGTEPELKDFNAWMGSLPHKHKVFIAGNHDWMFERNPEKAQALITTATYLQDSEVTVDGVKVYGSPWQPFFYSWAFNLYRGTQIKTRWDLIPEGLDVLVTHGPPAGILDLVPNGERVGCQDLLNRIQEVKPKLHIFGHIHHSYGQETRDGVTYVNASTCNERYQPDNPPIVIDL